MRQLLLIHVALNKQLFIMSGLTNTHAIYFFISFQMDQVLGSWIVLSHMANAAMSEICDQGKPS